MTQDNIFKQFEDFFNSEYKTMFISGTDKHKIEYLMKYIFENINSKTLLLRSNSINNMKNMGIPEEYHKKKIVAGNKYIIGDFQCYFDSMLTPRTWNKTHEDIIDIAIVYPVDSLSGVKQEECINDLEDNDYIKKVVYVSWYENKILTPFYNATKLVYIDNK